MQFHDPLRPHQRPGIPCWAQPRLAPRKIPLPPLTLMPRPSGKVELRITVPREEAGVFTFLQIDVRLVDVEDILVGWVEDPERTAELWFGFTPEALPAIDPTSLGL